MKCPKCRSDNTSDSRYCKECAAPLTSFPEISAFPAETLSMPLNELATGSVFAGRYKIIEELGKGGMGKVYKVVDQELGEKMALKLIRPEVATDVKTIERFRNELRLARKIVHKNICRMFDLNQQEGTFYITMEFVPGEDLRK